MEETVELTSDIIEGHPISTVLLNIQEKEEPNSNLVREIVNLSSISEATTDLSFQFRYVSEYQTILT